MDEKILKEFDAVSVIMDSCKKLSEKLDSGLLSPEEFLTAKALVMSNALGCDREVAMMMATCWPY